MRSSRGGAAALALVLLLAVSAAAAGVPRVLRRAAAAAQAGHVDEAFYLVRDAAAAHPRERELITARDLLRERAVVVHLQRAWRLAGEGEHSAAALQYRAALALDPENQDARQGLASQYPPAKRAARPDALQMRVKRAAPPVNLEPAGTRRGFQLRTALRAGVRQIAAAYGITALVANDLPRRRLHLDVSDASFAEAMRALAAVSGLSWIAIDAHTIYVGTPGELRDWEPLATRTFYLPWIRSGVMLTQVSNTVRSLLGIRDITTDAAVNALTLRARPAQLDAAEQLLLDLRGAAGEVVLQVQILEVTRTAARDLGIDVPDQFTMFSLGPLLEQLQQSGGLSQSILTLFAQGGLNAVLNSGLLSSGALAQASSVLSPLLQNPFVVFGGGATLMAISVPNLTANFSGSHGSVSTLETALLRALSGQAAELRIGEKYPVINASFAPITLNPALSAVIGTGSYTEPFPSFTFEDIGLDAKMTPDITPSGAIRLQLDVSVSGLTGVSTNDIPVISNRHVVSTVTLRDGVPALVAGLFNRQQMRTLEGLPGLGELPGFGQLFSEQNAQTQKDELALLITPHLVRLPEQHSAATWLPPEFAPSAGAGPIPFRPQGFLIRRVGGFRPTGQ
ncbi:MAG: type II secretion system protein GspD [Terriglobales bacterium]